MEDLVNEFRNEASEIIEDVQSKLMTMEEDNSVDMVDDIFRGIHTLKGSSRMFGYIRIEKITHELENIFDAIRSNKRKLEKPVISLSLKIMDMAQSILNDSYDEKLYFDLYSQLQVVDDLSDSSESHVSQEEYFQILYHPSKNIFERGVNPMAAIDEIRELGEVEIFEIYRELSDEEQEKKKSFHTRFEILIHLSKVKTELEDVFLFLENSEFSIHPFDPESDLFREDLIDLVVSDLPDGVKLSDEFMAERDRKISQFIAKTSSNSFPRDNKSNEKKSEDSRPQMLPDAPSSINYINVKLDRLDEMMKMMSELVSVKAELRYHAETLEHSGLSSSVERLEKIAVKFKDNAFKMRLVPLQILSLKLQRLVRDASDKLGKEINLITEGLDTEIDKSIITEIEGPILHIIQNAIDHGIESPEERKMNGKAEKGSLKILAFYAGANVFIQIQDDGRGLNIPKIREIAVKNKLIANDESISQTEAVNLIFKPGFTTNNTTTAYSGRGVGLDVVMNKLRQMRGSIEVTTEKGLGTSFTLRLPLSLSIIDVLHFKVGSINYLIPHNEIVHCLNEKLNDDIILREGYNMKYDGKLIPNINLMEAFDEKSNEEDFEDEKSIIVLNKNDQFISVEVENIIGEMQLVIKPVDDALNRLAYLSGVGVLGNGELAFLLDSLKLKEYCSSGKSK